MVKTARSGPHQFTTVIDQALIFHRCQYPIISSPETFRLRHGVITPLFRFVRKDEILPHSIDSLGWKTLQELTPYRKSL